MNFSMRPRQRRVVRKEPTPQNQPAQYTPLHIPQDMKGQQLPINQLKGNPPVDNCSVSNVHRCNTVILNETIDEYNAIVIQMERQTAEQQRIVAEWDEQIKNNTYRNLYNAVVNEFIHLISLSLSS
jgi:hypothetical protein